MPKKHETTDAIEILDRRYREQVPDWDQQVAEEEMRTRVGIAILAMRRHANLSQQELADRVGITQPMLSQLENADYDGSSLDMLWRVCKSLSLSLEFSCKDLTTGESACSVPLETARLG